MHLLWIFQIMFILDIFLFFTDYLYFKAEMHFYLWSSVEHLNFFHIPFNVKQNV